MADPVADLLGALRRARGCLASLLDEHPDAAKHAGAVLKELTKAEDACARFAAPDADPGPARTLKSKRYERHRRGGEDFVAEFRSDSPYPFRVPKIVLDAVVHALASAKAPQRSSQVRDVVRDQLGEDPIDYQVHTCLRFLVAQGLVRVKSRTYAAVNPKALRKQVARIWDKGLPAVEE